MTKGLEEKQGGRNGFLWLGLGALLTALTFSGIGFVYGCCELKETYKNRIYEIEEIQDSLSQTYEEIKKLSW